jgi:2-polyprenyl-3-methyl-5-hydroxy-6-metoxy-1,4-benzoquinol methylase
MSLSPRPLKISDQIIEEVNRLLDWRAAAPLPDGRILGLASPGKRESINVIPDKRITLLNQLFPLASRKVLEIGCFEGIHTMGLLQYTDHLTCLDLRPINVIKTLARLSLSGRSAAVFQGNCEDLDESFGSFDLVFHFGVLYHLMSPVQHLRALGRFADSIYLDTHIAPSSKATQTAVVDGESYRYSTVDEAGWLDPFSGADPTSIHLTFESLKKALGLAGFVNTALLNFRQERNGPRLLMFASRSIDTSRFPTVPDPEV